MNSKEKAKALVDKMKKCLSSDGLYDAKQCALVCCDEILLELKSVGFSITNEKGQTPEQYFDEVKFEIEKP